MNEVTHSFRSYFQPADTTLREFGQSVSEDTVKRMLMMLEESGYSDFGQVCYVVGMGGHPRSSYAEMEGDLGIRVVHYESGLPRGLRFLPSYRGLVKVEASSRLHHVFERLAEQSTVAAYIFDAALEERFVDLARRVKHGDHNYGVKADPGYLIYLVDEDRDDSATGMVEFLSYGSTVLGRCFSRTARVAVRTISDVVRKNSIHR